MRFHPPSVAGQLKSVATRYRPRAAPRHSPRLSPFPFAAVRSLWLASDPAAEIPSHGWSERDQRLARLEAILFLAREPLSTRKLSQYANLADATEALTLIRLLNERFDLRGRAFRVEEVAGGYQLRTRPKFAAWLRRLDQVPKETRLSAPTLETLAVIAYRQPVARAQIEAVRGVNCGEILRQLMERDLIRISGRGDELGRPYLYATTKWFLQLFGLRNLDDLPRAAELKHAVLNNAGPMDSGQEKTGGGPFTNPPIHADSESTRPVRSEEEPHVTATISPNLSPDELKKLRASQLNAPTFNARDDAEEEFDDEEVEDEEEDWDDEEDDEDFEDEEFDELDDDEEDEEDDELDDEDLEDEEWEEVEDEEEEEWDDDEEDDDDWDDDDDEEEEEEEEGWE